jgi:hypothetical protein
VRIGAILHPAVLLALKDGYDILQHRKWSNLAESGLIADGPSSASYFDRQL